MKRGTKGFTLVELLVVIGIIALLISILLPSLNAARHQAGVVRCAAQMRGVFQGIQIYANDNRGLLPPSHYQENGNAAYIANRTPFSMSNLEVNMLWTMGMCKSGVAFSNVNEPGALFGRLQKTRYVSNTPKAYTCPAAQDTSDYHAVYYFNPHIKSTSALVAANSASPYTWWWNRLPNWGKYQASASIPSFRHAIMTDPMYDIANNTHARGSKKSFNLCYPDGSVSTYTTTNLATRNGNLLDHWGQLLDFSNAIQYSADGGSVVWSNYVSWNNKFNIVPLDPQ